MKHLKSTSQSLRELFEQNISVRHIAEPLTSFDSEASSAAVHAFMEKHDYDVVGVRREGLIIGYVKRSDLMDNSAITSHVIEFSPSQFIDETAPLISVLSLLRKSPMLFVRVFGQVGGIITRGDLQKAPVRMWLFGLITLVEMQLLRLIREAYPNDSWKPLIRSKRIKSAEEILADRQKKNAAIDLADCLQFCDKRDIVLGNATLRNAIGFSTKKQGQTLLKNLEKLRNDIAHAQDIVTGYWPEVVDLAEQAEELLRKCEKFPCTPLDF